MADSDAYVITFEHDGRAYNVWLWPKDGAKPSVQVNCDHEGRWFPIAMDGGAVRPVEMQGGLF